MKNKLLFLLIAAFGALLFSATDGYSYPDYCPYPGTGCTSCHPAPGTGGWPACPPPAPTCVDNDGDGYGNPGDASCANGAATDCNDNNAAIHPNAFDIPGNGIDEDCNGVDSTATNLSDSDNDGVADVFDSAPLDPTNSGQVVFLTEGLLDAGQYGNAWGSNAHYTVLAASFDGNGADRLFHVQGYDIDFSTEIGVYLNNNFLGNLTPGPNNALDADSLWYLPASLQQAGENRVEFRQEAQPGYKWGVQRLGIFNIDTALGRNMAGVTHPDGFELHFQGHKGVLLDISGYDNDWDNEIVFDLNGSPFGGLPAGPNNGWTSPYQLVLPADLVNAGDNVLVFYNNNNPNYAWGIRVESLRTATSDTDSDGVGDIFDSAPSDPTNSGQIVFLTEGLLDAGQYGNAWGSNEHYSVLAASFLGNGADRLLHVQGSDIDFADEVGVYLNDTLLGYLTPGPDNALNADSLWYLPVSLQQAGENRVEFRQERQPGYKWGVQRLGIFDTATGFGKNMSGITHPDGFELHFQGNSGVLLEIAGYDSDWNNEIVFDLNGSPLGGLSAGPNNGWTNPTQFDLAAGLVNAGDNVLDIYNRNNPNYVWGVTVKVVDQASGGNPGPDYSDCTLCHGQPPAGSSFPNTAGAHAVHSSLASVGTNCLICHEGAAHNSLLNLDIAANFDAQSGPAVNNLDGTCSSVKCHGGQTTPNWLAGSINVNTQCASCHTRRTSGDSFPDQYNDYYSGEHNRHVSRFACTVCHNTTTLQSGHFSNLETTAFEQSPASTIGGGGSTRVGSYSNGTCSSIECHGSERW